MGSPYRRKSDGRWVAAVSIGGRKNRRRIVRFTPKDDNTKRAALALLDDMRKLVQPSTSSGRLTVGQYLRSWLDTAGKRSLKASTWRTYDVALRLHIDPAIGQITLARLTAEHVDTMLAGSDLEPKGQRNVLGFLGRVLDVAQDRGHVLRNAARLVEPPRVIRQEPATLSRDEARRVIVAVKGDRLEALWVTALGTGLRLSEILGLRWEDVDLERRTLSATYALVRVDGKYGLDEPKTARSRRHIAIPRFVVTALRGHRTRQLAERLTVGKATGDGLVFVTAPGHVSAQDPKALGGRPLNVGWVSHRWPKVAAAAGVDVTFHQLRHTHATILRDLGIPEAERMSRLGQTQERTHRDYAHDTDAPDRHVADELDEALG